MAAKSNEKMPMKGKMPMEMPAEDENLPPWLKKQAKPGKKVPKKGKKAASKSKKSSKSCKK